MIAREFGCEHMGTESHRGIVSTSLARSAIEFSFLGTLKTGMLETEV